MKRGIDYIGVGVGAIIEHPDGRVFLAQRGPLAKNERHRWEFPGGTVEWGETLAAALTREIYEEYGMTIAVRDLLDVVDHILPEEGQHWVSPTYVCDWLAGDAVIREPGKCAAIGWFALDQIPQPLTVITAANLAHYRQRRA